MLTNNDKRFNDDHPETEEKVRGSDGETKSSRVQMTRNHKVWMNVKDSKTNLPGSETWILFMHTSILATCVNGISRIWSELDYWCTWIHRVGSVFQQNKILILYKNICTKFIIIFIIKFLLYITVPPSQLSKETPSVDTKRGRFVLKRK